MMKLRHFLRSTDGGTSIEYVLIGSLVALVIIGGVSLLGEQVLALFDSIVTRFN